MAVIHYQCQKYYFPPGKGIAGCNSRESLILILYALGLLANYSNNHIKPESAGLLTLTLAKKAFLGFS